MIYFFDRTTHQNCMGGSMLFCYKIVNVGSGIDQDSNLGSDNFSNYYLYPYCGYNNDYGAYFFVCVMIKYNVS